MPVSDEPLADDELAALQLVCFEVGDQRYGLDILRVEEVAFAAPVTAVPGAPDFVAGIVCVHGVFVPHIDLRRRFGVPAGAGGRLLLCPLDGLMLAFAVDRVLDTLSVPEGAVAAAPPLAGTGHVAGVVEGQGGAIVVLDLDTLLTPAERRQLRALAEVP